MATQEQKGAADNLKSGLENGTFLEEAGNNLTGCSVMISYARRGTSSQ